MPALVQLVPPSVENSTCITSNLSAATPSISHQEWKRTIALCAPTRLNDGDVSVPAFALVDVQPPFGVWVADQPGPQKVPVAASPNQAAWLPPNAAGRVPPGIVTIPGLISGDLTATVSGFACACQKPVGVQPPSPPSKSCWSTGVAACATGVAASVSSAAASASVRRRADVTIVGRPPEGGGPGPCGPGGEAIQHRPRASVGARYGIVRTSPRVPALACRFRSVTPRPPVAGSRVPPARAA